MGEELEGLRLLGALPGAPAPSVGDPLEGGDTHTRVPAGVGTLPAPTTAAGLQARVWGVSGSVASYTALLLAGYRDTTSGYAAGVRHAATTVAQVLLTHCRAEGALVCKRLQQCCDALTDHFAAARDGFAAGVLSVTGELYVALDTYTDPARWGWVTDAPIWAGLIDPDLAIGDLWAGTR